MYVLQTLALGLLVFGTPALLVWGAFELTNRYYERQARREHAKRIHPCNYDSRYGIYPVNVKVLHLTEDDFYGCEACFSGRHGTKADDGRCLCCGFVLPNSYQMRDSL